MSQRQYTITKPVAIKSRYVKPVQANYDVDHKEPPKTQLFLESILFRVSG